MMDLFDLQAVKKALHHSVVVTVTSCAHAAYQSMTLLITAGIHQRNIPCRDPNVLSVLALVISHQSRSEALSGRDRWSAGFPSTSQQFFWKTNPAPLPKITNLLEWYEGNIRHPFFVWSISLKIPRQNIIRRCATPA
ncbi:MAG: hypothetical protein NVV73_07270 [Cellvibrionaceae bacterium]|nr:hypothetical protein [Cellvibrionaceae bacterium]